MNLETSISATLWQSVRQKYENRDYTAAILDAVYFLSNLIREKTGLESDGAALAGAAFGGNSPLLKVNKLQTESERDVQRGVEQILRGIFQAIRNPRSHEKHQDSQEDADAIIIFIDYLIRIIDRSKSPFTREDFLKRVFDPNFVADERYARLLVADIPKKQRLDVFIDTYQRKETGHGGKLSYFFAELFLQLEKDEMTQAFQVITEELKYTNNTKTMRYALQILPETVWENVDESVRLRLENKLLESVAEGACGEEGECSAGSFGTWISSLGNNCILTDKLEIAMCKKLTNGSVLEHDYIFRFIFDYVQHVVKNPSPRLTAVIIKGLANGDKRYYDAIKWDTWEPHFSEYVEGFVEKQAPQPAKSEDDDIPF